MIKAYKQGRNGCGRCLPAALGLAAVLLTSAILGVSGCRGGAEQSSSEPAEPVRVVFFGDSITYYGEWQEYFPTCEVYDLGVCGDWVGDLIDRFDDVRALAPEKLFIMAGINDLLSGSTEEETLEAWKALLALTSELQNCEVTVQGLLPVGEAYRYSGRRITAFNERLSALCAERGVRYVDLFDLYDDGTGRLDPDATDDGLHLASHAYGKWVERIRDMVEG